MIFAEGDAIDVLVQMRDSIRILLRIPGLKSSHCSAAEVLTLLRDGHECVMAGDSHNIAICSICPREAQYQRPQSSKTTKGRRENVEYRKQQSEKWAHTMKAA
jgi:hypothetical protein